jgi:ribosomal protein S10
MKQIIIKSSCNYTLKTYVSYLELLFKKLNISTSTFFLPTSERKITLLKSPHVYKKAKEQFKVSTHKVVISLDIANSTFLNKIGLFLINKPKAVFIKIKS